MIERGREIEDNIRHDMAATGVPWVKFQCVLAWVTRLKLMNDPEWAMHPRAPELWRLASSHG